MRQFKAIVRREVGTFFHSNLAPILLGGFLVLVGLLFTKLMIAYSDMSTNALESARSGTYINLAETVFRPMVSTMLLLVVLLMPSLTMRLFSPEYRSGRYNLLASWPVPDHIWVLGKWWSALISASVMILTTMVLFASVWFFGQPEPGPLFTVFLGLVLLASALLSFGTLASVAFSHQILAYFVALIFALLLFMVQLLERFLPGILGQIANELSLMVHFELFSRGVLDSRDVLFFLLMTMLPLVAATAILAGRRLPARRRLVQWLPTFLSLILAVVIYLLGMYFPYTVDLTGNKRYSLAPQTVQILKNLGDDLDAIEGVDKVVVYSFMQRFDPAYDLTEVLLQGCSQQSRYFRYEMVDLETDIELVKKYGVKVARSMVVEVGERTAVVLQPEETGLINAVYRLVVGKRPVIGYLQGHGEHRLDDMEMAGYATLELVLQEQGYDVRSLVLSDTGGVPEACDVLIIAGPRSDPLGPEAAAIDAHLDRGKAVLCMLDPVTPPGWVQWLAKYRVMPTGKVIITPTGQGKISRLMQVVNEYGGHEISRPMQGVTTLFPFAQALGMLPDDGSGLKGAVLIVSNEVSWAENDPGTRFGGAARFDPAMDTAGPVPVAMVLEVPAPVSGEKPGRMVVVGNSEFVNNSMINRDGNRDLFLNMVGWLAREENLIELRGRDPLSQPIILTTNQKNLIQWGAVVLWPLFVVSLATGIMLRHRRRTEEKS